MSDSRHGSPWVTSENYAANGASTAAHARESDSVGFPKMNLVKLLLFIFNVIFVLVGLALVSIGIWTAADKIYVSSLIGNDLFTAASYMIIVVGVITTGICILGLYCVFKPKYKWTVLYLGLLIFAALMLMVTAIIVVVFQSEVEDVMVTEMRDTLMNGYGSDSDVTDAWDKVQDDLECCAISQKLIGGGSRLYAFDYVDGTKPVPAERDAQDSWAIYKRTSFFKAQENFSPSNKKYVPASCCVHDRSSNGYLNQQYCQNFVNGPPTNYVSGLINEYLHYEGCYEKAKTLVMDQAVILIGLGFAFALVMIGGIFLSFLLMRQISEDRNSEANRRRTPDNNML